MVTATKRTGRKTPSRQPDALLHLVQRPGETAFDYGVRTLLETLGHSIREQQKRERANAPGDGEAGKP